MGRFLGLICCLRAGILNERSSSYACAGICTSNSAIAFGRSDGGARTAAGAHRDYALGALRGNDYEEGHYGTIGDDDGVEASSSTADIMTFWRCRAINT